MQPTTGQLQSAIDYREKRLAELAREGRRYSEEYRQVTEQLDRLRAQLSEQRAGREL